MARTIIPARTRRAMQDAAQAREFNTTIDVWRSPAPVNNKVGPMTEVLSDVPAQLREASAEEVAELAPVGLSGTRVEWLCRVRAEVAIRIGDELRDGSGGRYKVEGSANVIGILRTCVLSKIKPQ